MSKLNSIIRHEYLTIIRQPSFWIAMIAIPLLIGGIIALTYFGNRSSAERIEQIASELQSVAIVDESGLINEDVAEAGSLALLDPSVLDETRESVRQGETEALVHFPSDLREEQAYQIYLSSTDFAMSSSVSSLADNILRASLFLPLGEPEIIQLAQDGADSQVTMYEDGVATGGINDYIAPGLFVVLFYIIFAFSVSYMLTSVSEEKENRSMEMVLTYVKPRQLIVGKLLAVTLVTLTQVLFFALMAALGWLVLNQIGNAITLPAGVDMSNITVALWPIFFGAAFLVVGFLMFAGFMTATAAAAPSSKEANSFSTVFFLGAFIPFYFIFTVVTDPENGIVRFLTFFPLTSPVITLIRNTVGNMSLLESWLALGVMTAFMIVSIWLAVKAFRLGALEFSNTIKLSKLFKK